MVLGAINPIYQTQQQVSTQVEPLRVSDIKRVNTNQTIQPLPPGPDFGELLKKYGPYILGAIVLIVLLNKSK